MDMKRTATALGCVAAGLLALPAMAAPISIVNASFEAQILGENAQADNIVSGWTDNLGFSCPQCFGVFNPGVGNAAYSSGNVADWKLYLKSRA